MSSTESIVQLQEDIARFSMERERCIQSIKELMAKENPSAGIFYPREIFELQQEKLRLDVEIDFRQRTLRRMQSEP